MREKTSAHRNLVDDVPEPVKKDRLQRMIDTFISTQKEVSQREIGNYHLVLVDGTGKKERQLKGKSDTYRSVIFETPLNGVAKVTNASEFKKLSADNEEQRTPTEQVNKGDYVIVKIDRTTSGTLFGEPVCKVEFNTFFEISGGKHVFRR